MKALLKALRKESNDAVLARGAGGALALRLVSTGAAFCVHILLARLLGSGRYGFFVYTLNWTMLLALLSNLGMETALVRFVASYNARRAWGLLRGLLRFSMWIVGGAAVLTALAAGGVVLALSARMGPELAATFAIALAFLPVYALTSVRRAALRALKHVVCAAMPENLLRPAVVVILCLVFHAAFPGELRSTHVMLFNSLGMAAAFGAGTIWLLRFLPGQARTEPPEYRPREWIRVSLPLLLITGMHLLLRRLDVLMIGALRGTEQAGIYSSAARIASIAVLGLTSINAIVAPMISELHSRGEQRELQRVVALAARGLAVFTLLVGAALAGCGRFALGLFGPLFREAYGPLLILLAGFALSALSGPVGFLMTMTGQQNRAGLIIGLGVAVNIAGNALLIPRFGLAGAATATAASMVLWNVLMLVCVWRRMGINATALARIRS